MAGRRAALLWKATGLGKGVPSVAVAGGRIFTLCYRDDQEYLTAFAVTDGKRLWATSVGPAIKESSNMRWLSQRTPAVDADRVYAFTAREVLVCVAAASGKEQWRKDHVQDFAGKRGRWGFCDFRAWIGTG